MEEYVIKDYDSDSDIELDITKYQETTDKLDKLHNRHYRKYVQLMSTDNIQMYAVNERTGKRFRETKEEIPLSDYDSLNNASYDLYDESNHEICTVCNLTSPCKHHVRNREDGKIYLMDGISICSLLMDEGVDVSTTHFSDYEDIVINQNNMSDDMKEKIVIFNHAKARMEKISTKIKSFRKKYEENGKKYTSSSRLERLKNKHNISP